MMKKMALCMMALWLVNFAGAQGLRISELLYQPVSGEAEYLELYNDSEQAVDLSEYHVVRWIGDSLGRHYGLPSHIVQPRDYVVLTTDAASLMSCFRVPYASKVVECALPTYPNNGGSVVLSLADSTVVEHFSYSPQLHSRLLRNRAGVALERRRFDLPVSAAGNWFSAASTVGYGTPGYTNSQSSELLVEETAFTLSADVISPDGDGYNDQLLIDYQTDDGSLFARVDVYDHRGLAVCSLLAPGLLGTHGQLQWDGRDTRGHTVPMGQYVVEIVVYDTSGTRQRVRRAVAVVR